MTLSSNLNLVLYDLHVTVNHTIYQNMSIFYAILMYSAIVVLNLILSWKFGILDLVIGDRAICASNSLVSGGTGTELYFRTLRPAECANSQTSPFKTDQNSLIFKETGGLSKWKICRCHGKTTLKQKVPMPISSRQEHGIHLCLHGAGLGRAAHWSWSNKHLPEMQQTPLSCDVMCTEWYQTSTTTVLYTHKILRERTLKLTQLTVICKTARHREHGEMVWILQLNRLNLSSMPLLKPRSWGWHHGSFGRILLAGKLWPRHRSGERHRETQDPRRTRHAGTHGDAWGRMGTHGDAWGRMGTHGDTWGRMGTHGDAWRMWWLVCVCVTSK